MFGAMKINWKIAIALIAVGYVIFLAYEYFQASSAVGSAAGAVGGQLEEIWNGLTASAGDLGDAGSQIADTWEPLGELM